MRSLDKSSLLQRSLGGSCRRVTLILRRSVECSKMREKTKVRQKRTTNQTGSQPQPDSVKQSSPNIKPSKGFGPWILNGLCLIVGCGIVYFIAMTFQSSPVPRKLVGLWKAQDSPLTNATFKVEPNGNYVFVLPGRTETARGTVVVRKDKLYLTSTSQTGEEHTKTQTIKSLSDNELVLRVTSDLTVRFRRVK